MTTFSTWLNSSDQTLKPIQLAMMFLSLLAVVVVLILAFAELDEETMRLLVMIDFTICMIFLSHFFWGLLQSNNRLAYIKLNWIDFVASIPAIEYLRFARLFQILRVIRLIRMTQSLLIPMLQQRKQATIASLLVAMITILSLSSVLILIVEGDVAGSNIQTAEHAIWWTLVTISTVGYGDHYPITTAGHIIGGMVIVCGVSFFGVISGYMASLFISPDESDKLEKQSDDIRCEFKQMLDKMEQNQQKLLGQIAELQEQLDKRSD